MIRAIRAMGIAAPKAIPGSPVSTQNNAMPPKAMIPSQAKVTEVLSSI